MALVGSSVNISGSCVFASGIGIRSSCDGLWVADNKLHNTAANDEAVGVADHARAGPHRHCDGANPFNQIDGYGRAGIEVLTPVRDLIIKLNIIASCGNGIVVTGHPDAGVVSIETTIYATSTHGGRPGLS